jgi:hypothetical protein
MLPATNAAASSNPTIDLTSSRLFAAQTTNSHCQEVSMQDAIRQPVTESDPGQGTTPFIASVRQALEHICDAAWLRDNSYLQSVTVHAQLPKDDVGAIAMTRIATTGIAAVDARLQRIWRDWADRAKTPLQSKPCCC